MFFDLLSVIRVGPGGSAAVSGSRYTATYVDATTGSVTHVPVFIWADNKATFTVGGSNFTLTCSPTDAWWWLRNNTTGVDWTSFWDGSGFGFEAFQSDGSKLSVYEPGAALPGEFPRDLSPLEMMAFVFLGLMLWQILIRSVRRRALDL